MLLAVDVGNTDTTIGVFDRDRLAHTWRIATQATRTPDELALLFSSFLRLAGLHFDRNVSGVAVASVVPRVTLSLREMVTRYFHFDPLIAGPGIKTGMPIKIDNPKEVGTDRVVGAVAAYEEYGGPVVVVDVGTATTFDAVSEEGEFLGGAIAPGLDLSANALVSNSAQLKRVEYVRPPRIIGKSTVEAIQSGVVIGYACLVEGMMRLLRKELGTDTTFVMTGGLAGVMEPNVEGIDAVDPWLVLKGLRLVYERNT